jgi:hypothetical protein
VSTRGLFFLYASEFVVDCQVTIGVSIAGVDFLTFEAFFRPEEVTIALKRARESGLPLITTMSFLPRSTNQALAARWLSSLEGRRRTALIRSG